MEYPFWNVSVENDCAMNVEADTDMGNLTVDEFRRMFPRSRKVTQEQVHQGLEKMRRIRAAIAATPDEGCVS
ncbi:hypothetical protein [Mycobacteroides franklinii]|nr:hypothetical protein [Mycobacteroides franklinii]